MYSIVDTLDHMLISILSCYKLQLNVRDFVVSNCIACLYSLRNKNGNTAIVLYTIDLTMVAVLFSANGATVRVIALIGNSHVQWNKVCHILKKYCIQSEISIVLSMLGSLVFLLLVIISNFNIHKRSTWSNLYQYMLDVRVT